MLPTCLVYAELWMSFRAATTTGIVVLEIHTLTQRLDNIFSKFQVQLSGIRVGCENDVQSANLFNIMHQK